MISLYSAQENYPQKICGKIREVRIRRYRVDTSDFRFSFLVQFKAPCEPSKRMDGTEVAGQVLLMLKAILRVRRTT